MPIERYGSPIHHGPKICTREEHDSEQGRLVVAEEDQNDVEFHAVALAARSAPEINKEPKSIEEAFQQTDENRWREAIDKELLSLDQNHTWDVTDRHLKRNVVGSKWVFKIKRNADGSMERLKVRIVAQSFSQIPGHDFDETFAPVARYDSLRILLRISAQNKWISQQMDVNSAYPYGTLEEEISMELPPGYRTPGKCAKLRKCIYGFETTTFDPCVFVHPTEIVFISIYVDDIFIFGPDNDFRQHLKTSIGNNFDCKDLEDAKYILGLEIIIHSSGIRLSQQGYSKKILERFGFTNAHKVGTPLDPNVTLFKSTEEERLENVKEYQAIFGSLMYLVIGSRPDLAYTVTLLSQFSSCPNKNHLQAVKRTLRYLAATADWDLSYPSETSKYLEVYADASYANDPDTRRSTSGYVLRLGDAAISWSSEQQRSVALSTTEAEYMALSLAARQITWTKFSLTQLRQKFQIVFYADNDGAQE
ncbi:hypothetical protein K3495_g9711 [Podosphaera aphanis]|nr:hypothetical protein K3495_g9711 [Podosphaera aphanis]